MLRARGEPHAFDVLRGGLKIARVEWSLLGEHNQLNALAAIGAAEHVGVAPEAAARALGELPQRAAAPRAARRRRRHRGLRRLRPPPDRDAHDHRRPAPQGRRRAHPRRLRAALEHDEARRHEGAAAVGARGGRPRLLPCRRALAGTRPRRWRRWARRAVVADSIDELVDARRRGRAAGRPRALHEQRRLRRHPPEAARRARRAPAAPRHEHAATAAAARRSPTCSTCTAFARRRSRRRRASLAAWVAAHRPDLVWCCPQLDAVAGARRWRDVDAAVAWPAPRMAVIGSSLGGFYATAVAERRGCRAVRAQSGRRSGARPRRPHRRDHRLAQRRAVRLPARIHRRAARDRAAAGADRPEPLLRGHRQGRRGAVVARDERALRRLADCACSKAATTRSPTSTRTCRRCWPSSASRLDRGCCEALTIQWTSV